MYDITEVQRGILSDVWDMKNERWVGPVEDDYFSADLNKVEPAELLMGKNLLLRYHDTKNTSHLQFHRDGFFYLDEARQGAAAKGTDEVITAIKALYQAKKGKQATIAELAEASSMPKEEAFRALFHLRQFGLSISANLDEGPESKNTYLTPGPQIAKVTSFKALYEQRKKEHDSHTQQIKHWEQKARSEATAPAIEEFSGNLFDAQQPIPQRQPMPRTTEETVTAYCERCIGETNHAVRAEIEERHDATDPDADIHFAITKWSIIRCLGCNDIRFKEATLTSEDYLPGGVVRDGTVRIYPIPQRRKPKELPNTPDDIHSLYQQTVRALNEDMRHLCAGGLRAILDATCSDKGVSGGTVLDETTLSPKLRNGVPYRSDRLEGQIWGLAEANLVTKSEASVLHKHRFLGNDALHSALAPTADTLRHALDVIENVLDKIYELPIRATKIHLARPRTP